MKLSLVRGIPQNPFFDEKVINELIETFATRDDDVFICSFVKSGTTWLQQIVNLLLSRGGDPPKSYAAQVPWLEAAATGTTILAEREAPGWSLASINAAPGPRYFKTHANVADLPRGSSTSVKVVYIARNPKDVAVSLFHHARNKPDFEFSGTFGDLFNCFVNGTAENGCWFNHVLEWWKESQRDPSNVLFVRYEDMLDEPAPQIARIAAHLGLDAGQDVVNSVAERSSFQSMKNDKSCVGQVGFQHIRKGGAGGWRDVFTVRQSEAFDELYRRRMAGTGLQFDFGESLVM